MSTNPRVKDFFNQEMGPMTFGAFLHSARLSMDLAQAELARRLKISRSMICDIEKGRLLVSPALAAKIAKMAGFPIQFAVKYCLQDQLRKAKIKMQISVSESASMAIG